MTSSSWCTCAPLSFTSSTDHLPSYWIQTKMPPSISQVASFWKGSFHRTKTTCRQAERCHKKRFLSIFVFSVWLTVVEPIINPFYLKKTGMQLQHGTKHVHNTSLLCPRKLKFILCGVVLSLLQWLDVNVTPTTPLPFPVASQPSS